MSAQEQVRELILIWQEKMARGQEPALEELCRDCPELKAEVEKRIAFLRGMNRLALAAPDAVTVDSVGTGVDLPAEPERTRTESGRDHAESLTPRGEPPPDIPGYTILGELGRGGMGVVYKARQHGLNRTVALKIVLGAGRADERHLIRFLAEAEAVAAIQHPNVVEVHQFGDWEGKPFLALEFCPGGTLDERIKKQPLQKREAAEILARIADGVHAAHLKGIIHRDLKPQNILLDSAGNPKVTDFGIAKKGMGGELTRTDAILGTPAYMSPEQASGGTRFVGPESDVWSLGVIFYELLVGVRPFLRDTQWDTLVAVQQANYVPLAQLDPSIPRDLQLICHKCLSRQPKDRYATAGDLAADLRNYLSGKPIVARPISALETAMKWVKRNKPLASAIVAIFVSLFAGIVVSTWQAVRAGQEASRARVAEEAADRRAEQERLAKEQVEMEKARADQNAREARDAATTATQVADFMTGLFRAADPMDIFGEDLLPQKWEEQRTKTAETFLSDAAKRFRTQLKDQPLVRARLLARLGNTMKNLGMFKEASSALQEAVQVRRSLLPRDNPDTVASELDLGRLYFDIGDFHAALRQFDSALESQRRRGVDELTMAFTRFYRAATYALLGHPDAESAMKEVIDTRTRLIGPNHPQTLIAKLGRIAFLLDNGRANEVPTLVPDILSAIEAQSDGQFRDLCKTIARFQTAMALRAAARDDPNDFLSGVALRNAEAILGECLAQGLKLVPEDHTIIILFRFELAVTLDRLGKESEAERLFNTLLVSIRRGIGLAHPKSLVVLDVYTRRYTRTNRIPAARALQEEVDRANLERFGPDNFWRVAILLRRAEFEANMGSYDRAASLARDCIGLIEKGKVIRNRETARGLLYAARAMALPKASPAARQLAWQLFDLAYPLVNSAYGETSHEKAVLLLDHSHRLLLSGEAAAAAAPLAEARNIANRLVKSPTPLSEYENSRLHHMLGTIAAVNGRFGEAADEFARALDSSRKIVPADVGGRADDGMALAGALIAAGKAGLAVPVMEEVRRWRGAEKRPQPVLATVERAFALTLLAAGDREAYRAAVEGMLQRYAASKHANTQTQLAWALGMEPRKPLWNTGEAAKRLDVVLRTAANTGPGHRARALVLLRSGDLAEAELAVKKARDSSKTSELIDLVLLGLIALSRGDSDSARAFLADAERAVSANKSPTLAHFASGTWEWQEDATLQLLLEELRRGLPAAEQAPAPRAR
jgi:serine/threonine protein kinase/tetratricopeptide (TPR) repeat protein